MAGIYSQGGSAGHRYAGWLSEVEAKNFHCGGKVFNGSPSAIYVGSKMVWPSGWLTFATVKAILGAFLDDGMAVIKAANAYLNQLAAQGQAGKDKATALAGFINEDPMMVCSLGLQPQGVTMPIRYQSGNGSSYYNIGKILPSYADEMYFEYMMRAYSLYHGIFGTYSGNNSSYLTLLTQSSSFFYANGNSSGVRQNWSPYTLNMRYEFGIKYEDGKCYTSINGTVVATDSYILQEGTYPLYLFARNLQGTADCFSDSNDFQSGAKFRKNGADVGWFLPIKRNGHMELIDVISGNLATRVGTFTEAFYLPDGTPWTPSTP